MYIINFTIHIILSLSTEYKCACLILNISKNQYFFQINIFHHFSLSYTAHNVLITQ